MIVRMLAAKQSFFKHAYNSEVGTHNPNSARTKNDPIQNTQERIKSFDIQTILRFNII